MRTSMVRRTLMSVFWRFTLAQEQDSEKSQIILEAAARLMQRKSFKDLSMEELAQEAGVAKGTLYLYFRSKGDIYLSLLMKGVGGLAALVDEVKMTIKGSAREMIETILDTSLRLMKDSPFFGNIPILALPGSTPEEIEEGLRRDFFPKLEEVKKVLSSIFKHGIKTREFRKLDPKRLAGVFLHLLEYCFVHSLLLSDHPTDPEAEIPFVKELFFKGILA
ncbi:TetR family transcriptional regulator [candidate division WOR-3 bacterium]|uniref:TetR family transcriptional regulator n=1 Tax=candidate division WOR-3 bacterium TaxID=2052148 RepID=A0A9D5QCM8_UNCW3|nr:TetR family transcriptional regulator [candidate division WOR-3 bacterium]MBD3364212.1 TetR family transcriptional regulator [candidate division WOR-3 bacterium]